MTAQHIGALATDILDDLARRTGRTPPMAEAAKKHGELVERQVPAPVARQAAPESAAVLSMIERAAKDATVDVDKMLRLMDMRKEVLAEAAERDFDDAMAEAQREMQPVRADLFNSQTKSRYASYAALDRAMRPIYTKHGFAITFDTDVSPVEGCVRVIARVSHTGGCRRFPKIDMPNDGKGAKGGDVMTKTHAQGSAASYGMRYLLKMIFNLAVGDGVDDDGNAAGATAFVTDDQVATIDRLLGETKTDRAAFLKWAKAERVEDIEARHFPQVLARLQEKLAAEKVPA